ncbi:MAG: outer membrane protein assembly factor BamC [Proteobacteria bacterium]|nr:outer membrane protein assembly factor BamC [Pseudomonadota bacterium]HQR02669.1 outer membrane protein assembly factor BamC [Rhodocyclaceae bacterium]
MKYKALLLSLCLGLLVSACSTSLLEPKKVDYKSAGQLPPLEVPPDLSAPGRDERYAVPDIGNPKGAASFSTYSSERGGNRASTAQDVLPQIDKMHIERSGTQRWLVVPGTPDKLWPRIKEFWQDMGFLINVERPEAGVMETDWAEDRAKIPQDVIRNTLGKIFDDVYSTPERDKFRTRLEPGQQPGTTEIYISHRGMYEVYITEGKDQTRWEPRPADPGLEAEMLRRLMVRLGVDETRAAAMLAEGAQERAKLNLAGNDGSGTLEVLESFDRAWRRVGLALDRVGFTVEDRDRSQGLYYVRYADPDMASKQKDGGWLSKLAFWKSDTPATIDRIQYRIYVKANGENATVQVLTREGGVDKSPTSKKILNLLFEQLK